MFCGILQDNDLVVNHGNRYQSAVDLIVSRFDLKTNPIYSRDIAFAGCGKYNENHMEWSGVVCRLI